MTEPLDDESAGESGQPVINYKNVSRRFEFSCCSAATRGESLSRQTRKPQIESVKKNLVIESCESMFESLRPGAARMLPGGETGAVDERDMGCSDRIRGASPARHLDRQRDLVRLFLRDMDSVSSDPRNPLRDRPEFLDAVGSVERDLVGIRTARDGAAAKADFPTGRRLGRTTIRPARRPWPLSPRVHGPRWRRRCLRPVRSADRGPSRGT